jgi:hypothetical protein
VEECRDKVLIERKKPVGCIPDGCIVRCQVDNKDVLRMEESSALINPGTEVVNSDREVVHNELDGDLQLGV